MLGGSPSQIGWLAPSLEEALIVVASARQPTPSQVLKSTVWDAWVKSTMGSSSVCKCHAGGWGCSRAGPLCWLPMEALLLDPQLAEPSLGLLAFCTSSPSMGGARGAAQLPLGMHSQLVVRLLKEEAAARQFS